MKELSIEEKANRYDEAIEVINKCETDKYGCIIGVKPTDIFPELKESEDERIRQKLLYICYAWRNNTQVAFPSKKDVDAILAWLEKQGEQKHAVDTKVIIPKFRVGDTIRIKNSDAEYTITEILDGYYCGKGWHLDIATTDECGDYELVEQNPAWSEEDEKALDSMLNDIKQGAIPDNDDINWLKSFKERVQLQPQTKQEWSDEDEKARLTTEFVLMKAFGVGTPLVDWLRKLKDRATVLIN